MTVIVTPLLVALTNAQGWQSWDGYLPRLTKSDHALIHEVARDGMIGKPVGTISSWENTETGNSGTVELLSRYQQDGNECQELRHVIYQPNEERQVWEVGVCSIDGAWKWPQPPIRR